MNILSIDLESWVHFYREAVKKDEYAPSSIDRRNLDDNYIPHATAKLLELLEKYDQKATFFVMGEIYEWYPETIRKIEKKGHEIGYHTHDHLLLTNRKILRDQLRRSRDFMEEFHPIGFRAPQAMIHRDSMPLLETNGFKYSSSSYDRYWINRIGGIDEIPISAVSFRKKKEKKPDLPKHLTFRMLTKQIPFGSGLFIALLGARTSKVIKYLNRRNMPAILIVHPWQIYRPDRLRSFRFKLKVLFRNPLCLPYTFGIEKLMDRLLKHHKFVSFKDYYHYE